MSDALVYLLGLSLAGTALAAYAGRASRLEDQEDYYLAGRRVSGLVAALTYAATTYSAFMMVGLVGLSYQGGVGALGFELYYLVGTLWLLSWAGPKLWRKARERGYISPGDMLADHFGRPTAVVGALVASLALLPYTSAQIIGVSLTLEGFGLPYAAGVGMASLLVALWAYMGGLRGVAWTDSLLGLLMMASASLALAYVLGLGEMGFSASLERLGELSRVPNSFFSPSRFTSLTLPWFFFALTNPQVVQRTFIARDEGAFRRMVMLFGLFGFLYTLAVVAMGLKLRALTLEGLFPSVRSRDLVTPTLLSLMPRPLSLLVSTSIFAAALSTANSIALTLSSMLQRDLLSSSGRPNRFILLAMTAAVAVLGALRPSYIVELSVMSSTLLLPFLPLTACALLGRRGSPAAGVTSLLVGFGVGLTLTGLKVEPLGLPPSAWTLMASSVPLTWTRREDPGAPPPSNHERELV